MQKDGDDPRLFLIHKCISYHSSEGLKEKPLVFLDLLLDSLTGTPSPGLADPKPEKKKRHPRQKPLPGRPKVLGGNALK